MYVNRCGFTVLLVIAATTFTVKNSFGACPTAKTTYWRNSKEAELPGEDLTIICYKPAEDLRASFRHLWSSATFYIDSKDNYNVYKGLSEDDICTQHSESSSFFFNWFSPWRVSSISFSPFNVSCIGISSGSNFHVKLSIQKVDYWLTASFIFGIILFHLAPVLSQHILFYYGTGVLLGLLTSILILIFILSRFIPQKSAAYAFLAAGFSFTAFLVQHVWQNVQFLLESYYHFVLAYFALAGLISFAYCYYKGPVTNPRLLDLIKWAIQLLALLLIYAGSWIQHFSITSMVLVILTRFSLFNFGFGRILKIWRRRFPPKIRLLTEEEYIIQGNEETQKALEELKTYCRSPNCDAWKTISRLKSPNRFAQWVGDKSEHVTEEEMLEHDNNPSPNISELNGYSFYDS